MTPTRTRSSWGPLLVLPVLLALLGGCSAPTRSGSPEESVDAPGRALPEVTLAAFDEGEALDLAALRGPAVINLWASWCGPCRRELPIVQAFGERHRGVQVIGIDFQDQQRDAADELLRDTGADYPMYVDPLGDLSGRAPFPNMRGLPYTALVDARGELVHGEFVVIEDIEQLEAMVREHLDGEGLS